MPGRDGRPGLAGAQGIQGKQGIQGETPGGVLRLTDRRILIMFVSVVAAFTFLALRSETNAADIARNNYQTCRDFSAVISAANVNDDAKSRLPDCERLRP